MLKAHTARQTVGARAWASDMVESNAAGRAYREQPLAVAGHHDVIAVTDAQDGRGVNHG